MQSPDQLEQLRLFRLVLGLDVAFHALGEELQLHDPTAASSPESLEVRGQRQSLGSLCVRGMMEFV